MNSRRIGRRAVVVAAVLALAAATALGVHPQKWTADSEGDFLKGTTKSLVVTSHGHIRLAHAVTTLMPAPGATAPTPTPATGPSTGPSTAPAEGEEKEAETPIASIFAMVQAPDGTIYAGTGNDGKIVAIKDGVVSTFATLPEKQPLVTALLLDGKGGLLAAASGDVAQVYHYTLAEPKAEPVKLLSPEVAADLTYVWGMKLAPDGTVYLATGPTAKLIAISPGAGVEKGKAEVLFTSPEDNFVSLALAPDGTIYLGSDPHGLVYKFDPKTKKGTVLFDAPEPEISALTLDAAGNLYAATGAASASAGNDSGADHNTGRGLPDMPDGTMPKPPAEFPPNDPIPKGHTMNRAAGGSGLTGVLAPAKHPAAGPSTSMLEQRLKQLMSKAKAMQGPPPSEDNTEGNAVYKIDTEGFVAEVLRLPATIYGLTEKDGTLTLATGPDGALYQYDTRKDELSTLAKVDSKDISAMATLSDGTLALGLSNPAAIVTVSPGLAESGTYTSQVLDASAVAQLGSLRLEGTLPEGATLTVSTRSGNVEEPTDKSPAGSGWSDWTAESPAKQFLKITSPPGRYFQYRLTFKSSAAGTPSVRAVEAGYQLPNAAPKIKSITVADDTEDEKKPLGPTKKVSWEAEDPNGDALTYTLQYRPVPTLETPESEWRPLKDKLTDTSFEIDSRSVPDGRYQVRLTASDSADNIPGTEKTASRISPTFLVDNTPPTFSKPEVKVDGAAATVKFTLADAAGEVASAAYRLDAADTWQAASPDSGALFDSPTAAVTIKLDHLAPGRHTLTLKSTDNRNNESFATVLIDIAK